MLLDPNYKGEINANPFTEENKREALIPIDEVVKFIE